MYVYVSCKRVYASCLYVYMYVMYACVCACMCTCTNCMYACMCPLCVRIYICSANWILCCIKHYMYNKMVPRTQYVLYVAFSYTYDFIYVCIRVCICMVSCIFQTGNDKHYMCIRLCCFLYWLYNDHKRLSICIDGIYAIQFNVQELSKQCTLSGSRQLYDMYEWWCQESRYSRE